MFVRKYGLGPPSAWHWISQWDGPGKGNPSWPDLRPRYGANSSGRGWAR